MKKMQKMVPNMFTSPLAVKGDLSDKIDKAERWWLSLPAIICLVGAAVPVFIFVLQVSREYTVTCTYDPSLKKGSCGSSYVAQAMDYGAKGDRIIPAVTLADYNHFMEHMQNASRRLDPELKCECDKQSIRLEKFTTVNPKQIELCLALADMLDFKQPWTWSDMTKEGGVFHFFLVDMQSNNFWLKNQNKVKLQRIDQPNNQPSPISEIAWNGLINMCKLSKDQVDSFVDDFNNTRIMNLKILPKNVIEAEVVNRLDPKLVSSQFYSQIAVARTWVQAVTQDLMDTGAIEYTPGENAICKTDGVEGGKQCEGIAKAKRNTTAFPCSINFGYSQRETGLACDPLQDFFGAARSDSQGWKNYYLTPVCTSWKRRFDGDGAVSGEKAWIDGGDFGGDFGPKMKTLYQTIDWQKCSRSLPYFVDLSFQIQSAFFKAFVKTETGKSICPDMLNDEAWDAEDAVLRCVIRPPRYSLSGYNAGLTKKKMLRFFSALETPGYTSIEDSFKKLMLVQGSSSSPCGSSLCEPPHMHIDFGRYVQACEAKTCTYRVAGKPSTTESIGQVLAYLSALHALIIILVGTGLRWILFRSKELQHEQDSIMDNIRNGQHQSASGTSNYVSRAEYEELKAQIRLMQASSSNGRWTVAPESAPQMISGDIIMNQVVPIPA